MSRSSVTAVYLDVGCYRMAQKTVNERESEAVNYFTR